MIFYLHIAMSGDSVPRHLMLKGLSPLIIPELKLPYPHRGYGNFDEDLKTILLDRKCRETESLHNAVYIKLFYIIYLFCCKI